MRIVLNLYINQMAHRFDETVVHLFAEFLEIRNDEVAHGDTFFTQQVGGHAVQQQDDHVAFEFVVVVIMVAYDVVLIILDDQLRRGKCFQWNSDMLVLVSVLTSMKGSDLIPFHMSTDPSVCGFIS